MKHLSLLLFLGAALCIFSACGSEDSDEPVINEPVTDEKPGNKNDSTEVTVDWKDPAWYTVNFWERTDRQKAGLRGPVKKWHISNYTTYSEYEYDEAGHLIKKSFVDIDKADNNSEWRYTYDAKGHRIKAEYFDVYSEGTASEYWEYEYNNTGKFVAREWFMIGPEVGDAEYGIQKDISRAVNVIIQPFSTSHREYTYTFNAEGNLVVKEYTYYTEYGLEEKKNENTLEYTIVYEGGYPKSLSSDLLRFKVLNISYYPNGMYKDFQYLEQNSYNYETGWDRHTYKMLDNPRYLAVESFSLGGTASYISLTPQWMNKTYDEHFDIIKNTEGYTASQDPTYIDTWKDYTYDKYGNWITRFESVVARYTGDLSERTVNRVLEYFE